MNRIRTTGYADLVLDVGNEPPTDNSIEALGSENQDRLWDWLEYHRGIHPDLIGWLFDGASPLARATAEELLTEWLKWQLDE